MGKTTQSRHIIRLSQLQLVLQIQKDEQFYNKLLTWLKDKKHPINSLCTSQAIKRLQVFLKQQLKKEISLLQQYFSQSIDQQTISMIQKTQCDQNLIAILEILKHLYTNDDYYQEQDPNLSLFNRLMQTTDCFQIQTKLIALLMNTSFEKIEKEFFYHVYFLCDHLDIHDLKDSSIRDVYRLGKDLKEFRFCYVYENKEMEILIQDFYQFLWDNKLTCLNYRHITDLILKKLNLSLQKDSMIHFALLQKVKLYLKAVTYDTQGKVTNSADTVVQAIAYANAMYCYVQYFVIGQQITDHISIPNIFSFPPSYSDIFKELLQVFLLQESNKQTHLTIMRCINEILQIQEKSSSAYDIVGRLNDNSSLIYKYLTYAKNYLANQTSGVFSSTKKKVNLDAIADNQFVLELFKIMETQVQETHQLNSIACSIVEKIFKKETICSYNDKVINEAGNLLVSVEYEEEKLMKIILDNIQKNAQQGKPYLRVLNDLFSKKYHRQIQRRDLAYIARQSSQSCILVKMQDLIRKQVQAGDIKRDSFLMQTIQLIGNICEQSPTLLDTIQKTNPNIIGYLFSLCQKTSPLPSDIVSITDVINFMHHVSLVDGPVRNTMLKAPLIDFITNILVMDKFTESLMKNIKVTGGYVVGSINRFITNIKISGKYVMSSFIHAAIMINENYKILSVQSIAKKINVNKANYESQTIQINGETLFKLLKNDAKLINLLKMIEKTSSMVLKKFTSRSLYMLLRILLSIALERDNVFLDGSLEHSLLKLVINEIITAIKNNNELMQIKQKSSKNRINQEVQVSSNMQNEQQNMQQEPHESQPASINPPLNQRLITEQSQQPSNQQQEAGQEQENQLIPQNQENQNQNQNDDQEDSALQLFLQSSSNQEEIMQINEDISQIDEANIRALDNAEETKMKSVNNINEVFAGEYNFYRTLTWKMTEQYIKKYESLPEQVVQQLYVCYEQLDKLIVPLLSQQKLQTKQNVIKQISQNSIVQVIERLLIFSALNGFQNPKNYQFNLLNFSINVYSSKMERILKFLQFAINFENPELNLAQFSTIIEKFNQYVVFYLEIVSEVNAKNIQTFIQNDDVKYVESSKLPKSRIQNTTLDLENLRRNLQMELNQKWTLYNVLFDSFLRLVSGSLGSPNSKAFLKKPEGFNYFKLITQTLLENIEIYLRTKVLPLLKENITIQQFQRFRQAMKIVMQIFVLNDIRAVEKIKTQANLLITLYLYIFDPKKNNIISTLAKLVTTQERFNSDQEEVYEDTKINRWKYIKKVFLKMTFYKIKFFISQSFIEDIQPIEIPENQPQHPGYENQQTKNYFVFSRIHEMLCIFLENIYFSQHKNGYIRDILLLNTSLFSLFSQRITVHRDTIYFNYIFEDQQEKKLTEDEFNSMIIQRTGQLFQKILQNVNQSTYHYLTMLLKAIFSIEKPTEEKLIGKFYERIKELFYNVSRRINQIYNGLTGNNLCFGFALPRKKSISIMHKSKSQKQNGIDEELDEQEFDLKLEVMKFNNLLSFVIEFIKYFKTNEFFEQGFPKIHANYVKSIVEFGSLLLSNFEVENHFPEQGDELVVSIIRLIQQFSFYRTAKDEYLKKRKLERIKSKNSKNKRKNRKMKRLRKESDRQSISCSNQLQELSQNAPSKTSKKSNLKSQKLAKKSKKLTQKSKKKQKQSKNEKQHKKGSKQLPQLSLQQQHSFKGSILNRVVTDFLKISLTASQQKAFLLARTAQFIINFIQKFSKDVVLRLQTDINNIKTGKFKKKYRNTFFIYGSELFSDLLKLKVRNQKVEGFFYLITYLAMKLMTEVHVKIDFQCAIKRLFYEQEIKFENTPKVISSNSKNKYRITMEDFHSNLVEDMLDFPDLTYLLTIVEEKKKTEDQIGSLKKLNPNHKKQDEFTEVHHEFNKRNLRKLNKNPQNIYIQLKQNQELDVISLPSIKRRKPSQIHEDLKKVRFYQYHPEGDFAALICQIISHIIKIVIKQIVETFGQVKRQSIETEDKEQLVLFNLKVLLYTLQVLSRQSPTIVPWIARFKCKKILLNEFKNYGLTQQSEAYKRITSYVYGTQDISIQNFQQVSFLSLLIKLIYPVSQISTFIFELCLDNNVLIQDKSQKLKQNNKEVNEVQTKKWLPFGSIIRQKIVSEVENELGINKGFDQILIRNGFDLEKNNCFMLKKVSCMGLLTILLSIKEFAKICVENNLLRKIQDEYMRTSAIVRAVSNATQQTSLSLSSSVMRNFLINYFLRPMQILQELTIQYNINKKNSLNKIPIQFSNYNRVHIKFILTSDTINDQLFRNDIFLKSKFKSEWFYSNNLEGDESPEFQQGLEERQDRQSIDDSDSSMDDGMDGFFDNESEDDRPVMDQEIQEDDNDSSSIQISGQSLLDEEHHDNDEQQEDWYGSEDPFERESNTFQNMLLYPDQDHILESDEDEDDQSIDEDDEDIDLQDLPQIDQDDDDIDQYDDSDSEDGEQNGIDIELDSDDEARALFRIEENSVSPPDFWPHGYEIPSDSTIRIVPQVGIYHYFIPVEPDRRQHANHVCQHPMKPEIKKLQNLYEIFMDIVSFEHIVITNNMVKLENQQAKLIRKIFKVLSYKQIKGTQVLHNQHILKLEQEYYDQILRIFMIDSMFLVSEKIDFRECEKTAFFLQSLPIHYIDIFMDQPDVYFNELTKPLRGRRRGMFFNSHMIDRMRRADPSHYRSMLNPLRSRIISNPPHRRPHILGLDSQSSPQIANQNRQQENEEPVRIQEEQPEPDMHRIQFNVQNPNGGFVNFHADLGQILQNMGMSQRQFLSLPHDAQSDIIQNSLHEQLQRGEGQLNMLVERLGGHQAPNVSPVLELNREGQQSEDIHMQPANESRELRRQEAEIQMPQSFQMQSQPNQSPQNPEQMQEEHPNQQESPINEINNNHEQQDVNLPERYRKISLQHSQKISKDIIEILNKDHKNDYKFPEISQELLEEILQTIFVLENKDFSRFPYSFLSMNMINSKSCAKIIASLMTLLQLYPNNEGINEMIQSRKYGQHEISLKKQPNDLIPKLSLRTYLYEISKSYEHEIYPNVSIKILHILEHLTKKYSISMQMLKTNSFPAKVLEKYSLSDPRQQLYLSSFEALIRLLNSQSIRKSSMMVDQILRITNHIVTHYFEKNIFSIHQQEKQLKESKKYQISNTSPTQQKNKNATGQQPSILPVSLQQEQQQMQAIEIHKAIQLQQNSIQLLCSLLMSDQLRQSEQLSELIMKLSINSKNLILFIKNIETVLEKLCEKCIMFLNKEKKEFDEDLKDKRTQSVQVEQMELDDLMKVFCLLEIFSSMIKEFKQFAYRHHIDHYDFIMAKFKNIIESKALFSLCQTIASIISNTGEGNDLIKTIPEIFEIFFVVFGLNIEVSTNANQQVKAELDQKQANKIASLGQINEKHKNSMSKKPEQAVNTTGYILDENNAFNKLWNDKVCSPKGRELLNSTIKRKLSTLLKRKKQLKNVSLFDIPMIKIIINSPHLLDFENKRALFRAQMKRLKLKSGSDRTIYMSLDRKQVFQQSFNVIMGKKTQQLKNRIKIDFQGEQGEDVGGLTRQWYQLLSTQMFNPNYGLFRPSSTGNTYQPSSMSYVNSEHLNYFKFIGRIMGKALFDGYMLDAYFTPAFYKHILKIPITYLDMEEEDYEYFKSLQWILSNSPIEDYLDLEFTYEFDNFGQLKTKELIPNGQKIKVTQANKFRYVQLICYAKMATAVQAQLQKFLEGLHQIVPHKFLKIFDPKELEMMISGLPTIDIVDLKRNTELMSYQKTDQIIIWFFEVLESFDMSLRTAFLQFVTGTSRVPPEGFKGLNGYSGPQKFTIQKQFDVKKLPRAHTCFNTLDLPPYPTKQILIEKLTYAITQGKEGFGIA